MSQNSPANTPAAASSNSSHTPSPQNTPQHITLPEPFVNKLRKQIEFYFSHQNLQKDAYLRNIMMQYGGSFVPLVVICQFPKVVRLCESFNLAVDPFMILRVMEGSPVVFVTMDAVWIGIRGGIQGGVGSGVQGQGQPQGVQGQPQGQGQPQAPGQGQPVPMPTGPVRSTSLGVMPNPGNHVAGAPTLVSPPPPPNTTTTTATTSSAATGKDTPTSHTTSASNESSPSSSSISQNNHTSDTVPVPPSSPSSSVSPSRNVPRPNLQMRSHTTGQFTRMHPQHPNYMYPMQHPNNGHGHGHPMMRRVGGMVPPPPSPSQPFYGNVMMPPPMRGGNVRYMQGYTYVGSTVSSVNSMQGYKYFHPNQNGSGSGRPPVVMNNHSGNVNSGNSGNGGNGGNHNNNSGGGMTKTSSNSNLNQKNNGQNGNRKTFDKKKKKKEGRGTQNDKKKKKKDVNLDANHFPALGGGKKEEEKKVVVPVVSGYAAALLAKKEKKEEKDGATNSEAMTATEETSVQELEKQVGAMNMENDAIAVGALTGSPVKISQDGVDGTEKTMPQSKKIESIEIDGPTPKEAALPPKSEALDGKVDSVAVQPDAKTPSTETAAPVSSSSNSPSPPAAWGGKRSFIDVVKKQP